MVSVVIAKSTKPALPKEEGNTEGRLSSIMTHSERHTVAVFSPVKNCADLLDECLSNLGWADEIVIGDASDNNEIEQLLQRKYPHAKHFFDRTDDLRVRMDNLRPHIQSDYVLWVDSDEMYTAAAGREILEALRKSCAYNGFLVPSVSYNYGACLGKGATQMRLFRNDNMRWQMQHIHEMPSVSGPVGVLKEPYHHHNNPVLGTTAMKHFRYEAIDAQRLTDDELREAASQRKSLLVKLLRLNWRFLRTYRAHRHLGFAGLCMAYADMFKTIAEEVAPIEELRIREGVISGDRRGYF